MVRPLSKIFAVALFTATLGGLMLVPSVSAASDLGGKFQIKATNSAQNQFWAIRGYHAPGQKGSGDSGSDGSNPNSGDGGTNPGDDAGATDPGDGSGGSGSDPSDPSYSEDPGTSTPAITAGYWSGMAYGAGRYLAVSYLGDQTLSSADEGRSWKTDALPAGTWNGVAYGSGRFVAASQAEDYNPATGGKIAVSSDGANWTDTRMAGYSFQSITYGNGVFVAVGDSTSGPAILTSSDGSSWTESSLPTVLASETSSRVMGLARVQFVNGQFYASTGLGLDSSDGTYSRSAILIRSSDGKSWSTTNPLPGTTAGWIQSTSGYTSYSRDKIVKTSSGLIQSAIELGGDGTDFFRSTDGGASWSKFTPTGLPDSVTPQFSVGSTVYAYSPIDNGVQLYSSTDGGSSWSKTSSGAFEGFGFKNEIASANHGNCTVAIPMDSSTAFRSCS